MRSRTVRLTVFRWDPDDGRGPWHRTYTLESARRATVLELLEEIYRSQDPGLAFRRSCGFGRCGICGLRVNGRPVLACRQTVQEAELLIEPLRGDRVLKDLIVRIGSTRRSSFSIL